MTMSENIQTVPPYELKTQEGRTIRISQGVNRHSQPIVVIDTFDINMQRQSTVKIGFKDIGNFRLALQNFQDVMLETMCDY